MNKLSGVRKATRDDAPSFAKGEVSPLDVMFNIASLLR